MRAVYRGTSELLLQNLPAYLRSPQRAQTEINCVLARTAMKRRCAPANSVGYTGNQRHLDDIPEASSPNFHSS